MYPSVVSAASFVAKDTPSKELIVSIDTPGIKGLGIVDIAKEEMSHYFLEMRALLPECKFHNCQHVNEPSCAIKIAVKTGSVESFRYKNYLSMYHGDDEHYRTVDY